MSKPRRMTAKQLAFAERLLSGDGPSAAHAAAGFGPNASPEARKVAACRMAQHPAIMAYVEAGRARAAKRAALSREDKLRRLAERVNHGKLVDRDGLKALEIHNLMTGDNAPQQVNVFGLSDLLDMVRKGNRSSE